MELEKNKIDSGSPDSLKKRAALVEPNVEKGLILTQRQKVESRIESTELYDVMTSVSQVSVDIIDYLSRVEARKSIKIKSELSRDIKIEIYMANAAIHLAMRTPEDAEDIRRRFAALKKKNEELQAQIKLELRATLAKRSPPKPQMAPKSKPEKRKYQKPAYSWPG